jgi:hypothetical protein
VLPKKKKEQKREAGHQRLPKKHVLSGLAKPNVVMAGKEAQPQRARRSRGFV